MGDVHKIGVIIRHGPAHPEFIHQIMPEPPVPGFLNNAAFPVSCRACCNVACIHMQPLQHCFAGVCQLLYRIHDLYVVRYAQVFDQRLVGKLMDTCLVAAQIQGDPVRLLMVQCCKQSFP